MSRRRNKKRKQRREQQRERRQNAPPAVPRSYEISPLHEMSRLGDETTNIHQGSYRSCSYESLGLMARVPLISSIVRTRQNQVAAFARPQPDEYALGYKIQLRRGAGLNGRAAKKRASELSDLMFTCGDPRIRPGETFETFTRRFIFDSLRYDQCSAEVVHTLGGVPAGIIAVDASTIRRATLTPEEMASGRRLSSSGFAQVVDDQVVRTFDAEEMIFGIRRPRTDLLGVGYGNPELDELAETIGRLIHAEKYNEHNFTHGLKWAGVLAVMSSMSPEMFDSFKRDLYGMGQGARNTGRTPVLGLQHEDSIKKIDFNQSNRDMMFGDWLRWLLQTACMTLQMDPAELGKMYGNEGQSSSLNSAGPAQRVILSKERGLLPLLNAYAQWINRQFIQRIEGDFELVFAGYDSPSEAERAQADREDVKSWKTINEVRKERGLPPLKGGDIIHSSTWVQAEQVRQQQEEMQRAQEEQAAAQNEDSEGGGESFDADALFAGSSWGGEE